VRRSSFDASREAQPTYWNLINNQVITNDETKGFLQTQTHGENLLACNSLVFFFFFFLLIKRQKDLQPQIYFLY
jgi:hypothetical protein